MCIYVCINVIIETFSHFGIGMSMENLFRQADMDLTKKYIPQMEAADISQ